jgi:hypothetical protein
LLTTAAQAIEIKPSGGMEVWFNFGKQSLDKQNPYAYGNSAGSDRKMFYQRNRFFFDIVASEALKGTVSFENNLDWGRTGNVSGTGNAAGNIGSRSGGGIGSRGVSIELLHAYIDWIVPNTDMKVRVGMQSFANPTFINAGNNGSTSPMVVGDNMAGVVASNQFTPNVGLAAFWFRPYAENDDSYGAKSADGVIQRRYNEVDMFGLAVPLTFQGITVVPWGAYGSLGRDSFTSNGTLAGGANNGRSAWAMPNYTLPVWGFNALGQKGIFDGDFSKTGHVSPLGGLDGQGTGWWLGLTGEITMWNPFRLAWDFNYGSTDFGSLKLTDGVDTFSVDCKRQGWYATVLAEYKLDFTTPGLMLWYASGDDDKVDNGSEMMPAVRPQTRVTSFGNDAYAYNNPSGASTYGLQGTWGVMAQLKDISFVKDLKHTLRVMYSRGTNDQDMAGVVGFYRPYQNGSNGSGAGAGFLYLTEKDSTWEVNLTTAYDLYKNLQLNLDLGYIKLNLDKSTWGKTVKDRADNAYECAIGLRYLF